MSSESFRFRLRLVGSMRLFDASGARIEIPSRKGQALLAMLATAPDGERRRTWLQDRLWGSRQLEQARSSLRTELRHLRETLEQDGEAAIHATRELVRLDLSQFWIDILAQPLSSGSEVLEGLDSRGEDGFEDWLRDLRRQIESRAADIPAQDSGPQEIRATVISPLAPATDWRPGVRVLAGDEAEDDAYIDELVGRLSRLRWIRASRGAAPGGAAYVIDVKRRSGQNGAYAALILQDGLSGEVLWTGQSRLGDADRGSDLRTNVAQLDAHLDQAEQRQAMSRDVTTDDQRTLLAQGRWRLNRLNRRDGDAAKTLFDRILADHPDHPEALVQKALAIGWSAWAGRESAQGIRELRALARQAMLADHLDGRAFMLAGIANIWLKNLGGAKVLLQQAVELNPSLAMAWGQLGACHVMAGEPDAGVEALRQAIEISPTDMHIFYPLGEMAMAVAMLGDWREAIVWADRSLVRRPRYWYAQMLRTLAFEALGRREDAAAAYAELLLENPGFTPDYIDWTPFADAAWPKELKRRLDVISSLPPHNATR